MKNGEPCSLSELPPLVYSHLKSCFEAIKAGTCSPKDGKGNAEFNPSVGIRSDGEALFNIIASQTGDLQRALTHMSGYPSKNGAQLLEFLTETAVGKVTTSVHSFMGYHPGSQVQSRTLLLDLARRFEIPDAEFIETTIQGVPLGIEKPIPSSGGIWPPRDPDFCYHYEPENLLWAAPMAKSAAENPDAMWEILDEEIANGWIETFRRPNPQAEARVKLCLLQKLKSDGTFKSRLIQDFARNGVNRRSKLDETIQLPSLRDVEIILSEFCNKAKALGETVTLSELDIKSAFRLLEVAPCERKYLYLEYHGNGKSLFGRHRNLPFGLRVSPYLFSRFLAVFIRTLDIVLLTTGTRLVVYVDDLLLLLREKEAVRALAVILVLSSLLGIPLAYQKLRPPSKIASFIGYEVEVLESCIVLKCSKARVEQVTGLLRATDIQKYVKLNDLESLVGKLVFLTANCKWLRRHLEPFYKHIATARKHKFSKIHLKGSLVITVKMWLSVLYADALLTRVVSFSPESSRFIGGSDASVSYVASWVVRPSSKTMAWTRISSKELLESLNFSKYFEGKKNSSSIALLELLGVLLCVMLTKDPDAELWAVCDSRAATCAVSKRSSPNEHFNKILTVLSTKKVEVVHISGSTNKLADYLSREQSVDSAISGRVAMFAADVCKFVNDNYIVI
jgi:hypothetical protein